MYSNNILNFQESTPILNACTKKSGNLLNAPYAQTHTHTYIYIYIYIYSIHSICVLLQHFFQGRVSICICVKNPTLIDFNFSLFIQMSIPLIEPEQCYMKMKSVTMCVCVAVCFCFHIVIKTICS